MVDPSERAEFNASQKQLKCTLVLYTPKPSNFMLFMFHPTPSSLDFPGYAPMTPTSPGERVRSSNGIPPVTITACPKFLVFSVLFQIPPHQRSPHQRNPLQFRTALMYPLTMQISAWHSAKRELLNFLSIARLTVP